MSLKDFCIHREGRYPPSGGFEKIRLKEDGKEVNLKAIGSEKQDLFHYFEEVLPLFDKGMVHANEIKKIISWYNLLIASGFDSFVDQEEEKEDEKQPESANEGEN